MNKKHIPAESTVESHPAMQSDWTDVDVTIMVNDKAAATVHMPVGAIKDVAKMRLGPRGVEEEVYRSVCDTMASSVVAAIRNRIHRPPPNDDIPFFVRQRMEEDTAILQAMEDQAVEQAVKRYTVEK